MAKASGVLKAARLDIVVNKIDVASAEHTTPQDACRRKGVSVSVAPRAASMRSREHKCMPRFQSQALVRVYKISARPEFSLLTEIHEGSTDLARRRLRRVAFWSTSGVLAPSQTQSAGNFLGSIRTKPLGS